MKKIISALLALILLIFPCAFALEYDEVIENGNYQWCRKGDTWYFCNAEGVAFPGWNWPAELSFRNNALIMSTELSDTRIGLYRGSIPNGQWGIIDNQGNVLIEPQYDFLKYFSENRALVLQGDAWGILDILSGEMIVPFERKYSNITTLDSHGRAAFCTEGNPGKYGFMDAEGNILIEPQYEHAIGYNEEGLAQVRLGGLWGLIDIQGNFVVNPQYDNFDPLSNGMYCVEIDGKFGALDAAGNVVIDVVYESFAHNSAGFVAGRDGQYGYMDADGSWILEPVYEYLSLFDDAGYAIVKSGGRYGIIDTSGEALIEPMYDEIHRSGDCAISKFGTWEYTEEAYHTVEGEREAYFDIVDGKVIPGGSSS